MLFLPIGHVVLANAAQYATLRGRIASGQAHLTQISERPAVQRHLFSFQRRVLLADHVVIRVRVVAPLYRRVPSRSMDG